MTTPEGTQGTQGTEATKGTTGPRFIPRHGGYEKLLSYQKAAVLYDATLSFSSLSSVQASLTGIPLSAKNLFTSPTVNSP